MSSFFMFILTWSLTQAPLLNHDLLMTVTKPIAQASIPQQATTVEETSSEQPTASSEQGQVPVIPAQPKLSEAFSILANKTHPLSKDFIPDDLIIATVRQKYGNTQLPKVTDEALKLMFDAADKAGYKLYLSSGYRDYSFQKKLFQSAVAKKGVEEANRWVARPGESEHQTGLAVDITAKSVNLELTVEFSKTKEYQWLIQNCAEFGFILRYPSGQESITGYNYEPWHYRYIGHVEIAQKIMAENLTFEAYLGKMEQ